MANKMYLMEWTRGEFRACKIFSHSRVKSIHHAQSGLEHFSSVGICCTWPEKKSALGWSEMITPPDKRPLNEDDKQSFFSYLHRDLKVFKERVPHDVGGGVRVRVVTDHVVQIRGGETSVTLRPDSVDEKHEHYLSSLNGGTFGWQRGFFCI